MLLHGIDEPRSVAENLAVVEIQLLEVPFRGLRVQGIHRAKRVLHGAVPSVRRRRGPRDGALGEAGVHLRGQLPAAPLLEIGPRELVRVVDVEVAPAQPLHRSHRQLRDVDILARGQLLVQRAAEPLRAPRDLASLEENGEAVPAAVQRVLLPNLEGVVREEIEDDERASLESGGAEVVDHGVEAADLPVPLHELLHVLVHVPAAEHRLAVQPLVRLGHAEPAFAVRRAR
mmetsp:Transcript_101716/g.276508  ORF Transcript_101716/g.276508 Transcript_101716/m.276508 type:complete len:230 (+) Transcript_101716:1071-1760(+)